MKIDILPKIACLAFLARASVLWGATELVQVQDSGLEIREGVEAMVPPAEDGTRSLEALVIEVSGHVRWRQHETETFRPLKVDEILRAGAEISTALRSGAKLRVGFNATIDIHSVTRVSLPEIVQDGDVLRTRAVVRRGKADFKVDKVGLANDFEVITPATTLAVRGTYFSVAHGGLFGTVVDMFNPAEISAAEVNYFSRNIRAVMVRNGQQTSESVVNPVAKALFKTVGPPPSTANNPDDGSGGQRTVSMDRQNPVTQGATVQQGVAAGSSNAEVQVALGIPPTDKRFAPPGSGRLESREETPFPPGLANDSFIGSDGGVGASRPAMKRKRQRGRRF